ncbi:MAG: amidohydrolase [Planctomycetes bacterium]|nr:amidohydrolase [Planctomycetota bacterium]
MRRSDILTTAMLLIGTLQPTGLAADELLDRIDAQRPKYVEIASKIWRWAEVGYKEVQSSSLLADELEAAGFDVQRGVAEIPTAFVAEFGSGKPVIGILAEYDALPGMEQEAAPSKQPLKSNKAGHACGHHLFGTASTWSAIAVKEELVSKKLQGTLRLYGCPAEEGGSGKVFMVRAGLFKDCDVVLHWHPGSENRAGLETNLANISGKFRFRGKAAHAAGAPHQARSALDAVMLFAHAVDLLREHVPQESRLHYVITNGGNAPNIVPDFAEVYMYARHPDPKTLDGIWARIEKCAEGAAIATETTRSLELVGNTANLLPNDALAKLLDGHLRAIGGVTYSAEEIAFAETLRPSLLRSELPPLTEAAKVKSISEDQRYGSTDVGDVSWAVPTGGFSTACVFPGVPMHSWQAVACGGTTVGHKGMVIATKTLTLATLELFNDPKQVAAARESFDKRRAGKSYQTRFPKDQKPALNYRDNSAAAPTE